MKQEYELLYAEALKNYKYVVKKTKYTVDGSVRSKPYIALCDKRTNLIVQVTDYADYLIYVRDEDMSFEATNEPGLYAVCQFLNFALIDNYLLYRLKKIEDVDIQVFKDFLKCYSKTYTNRGSYPSKRSVLNKRDNISIFLFMLCTIKKTGMKHIAKEDIIDAKYIQTPDFSIRKVNDYKIKVRYSNNINADTLMRDMPLEIVERFIKMSQIYDPELTFAIVLMAYGGLRQGEICNVRRKESCYGPGIIISYGDGIDVKSNSYERCKECLAMEIDIRDTLLLRSDGIYVGEIKRERMQPIFEGYVDIINKYYEKHLELTATKALEEYKPMFTTKHISSNTGCYMALTKSALRERINSLFLKHVLPSLENDSNIKLQSFYAQMRNHSWGAHAFRHWFTVSLVLLGCDEVVIQSARGDRNRQSSKTYLERKGELQNLYKVSEEILGKKIRGEAE